MLIDPLSKPSRNLVDNAWDADAEEVKIALPAEMSDDPITIQDDGSGMNRRGTSK
jgi:DNA mismatch repair ATPase MutL